MLASCDQGPTTDAPAHGPSVHLLQTNFDRTRTLAADADVVLSFDRFLAPFTVTRQSVAFRDEFGNPPASPLVIYDPVARTVTLRNPNHDLTQPWLTPNVPYKIVLGVPKSESDIGGLRAIDGATLDAPVQLAFFATAAAGRAPEPTPTCNDVLRITANEDTGCVGCHAPAQGPIAGLWLTSGPGLRATAIGRASQEMSSGALTSAAAEGQLFGVNMPIIAPNDPGNSYVIYKLMSHGEPPNAPTDAHVPLTDDETARLRDRIVGQPMPAQKPPLTYEQVETIRAWIAAGADTSDCP